MEAIDKAFESYRQHSVKSDILLVVDYRQPSNEKRLYVVDVASKEILSSHYVAHGTASTCTSNIAMACQFSNVVGSRKSSLGAMKTGAVYYGKYGKSLKLHGLEACNSQVFNRFIVMHSSAYVTAEYIRKNGYAGRSWGCLAIDPAESDKLIEQVKNGTFIYAHY